VRQPSHAIADRRPSRRSWRRLHGWHTGFPLQALQQAGPLLWRQGRRCPQGHRLWRRGQRRRNDRRPGGWRPPPGRPKTDHAEPREEPRREAHERPGRHPPADPSTQIPAMLVAARGMARPAQRARPPLGLRDGPIAVEFRGARMGHGHGIAFPRMAGTVTARPWRRLGIQWRRCHRGPPAVPPADPAWDTRPGSPR
jgi:hypothetical protein